VHKLVNCVYLNKVNQIDEAWRMPHAFEYKEGGALAKFTATNLTTIFISVSHIIVVNSHMILVNSHI